MKKIVVTEPVLMDEEVKSALSAMGDVSWGPFRDGDLEVAVADCEVLMVRLGRYIGETLLARAPKLQFIVTATTGLDHIDLSTAQGAGVRVISLRDCPEAIRDISATAEHTIGLLLALLRRTPAAVAHVLAGGWDRDCFWGTQLRGKRCGIIGYGRVGAMVAKYAAAFGMDVVAYDKVPEKIQPPAQLVSFEELIESSDVLSIHVTATSENRHLVDKDVVERLKRGAVLVNTARGSLVDEVALAEAVSAGHLLGVAIDVLEGEGGDDLQLSPLLACARGGHNVVITPHIGGATSESIMQAEGVVVRYLQDLLASAALES
jgi:D-3-phosphoglycerate dehydrogenase